LYGLLDIIGVWNLANTDVQLVKYKLEAFFVTGLCSGRDKILVGFEILAALIKTSSVFWVTK
jgi:hypothetical protein